MASPKKITTSPKKKKSPPKAPGKPMNIDDLPDLPRKPNGEYNFETLGAAASTAEGRKQSTRALNTWCVLFNRPEFQELTKSQMANDNLEQLVWDFACFVASVPIPKNYQAGFAPPSATSKSMVMISTITKWIYGICRCLREKFPDHETWPSSLADNPKWVSEIIQRLLHTWKGNYINKWSKDADLQFGQNKIRAVYSEDHPHYSLEDRCEMAAWYGPEIEASKGHAMDTPYSGADLRSMMRKAFKESTPLNSESFYKPCREIVAWCKIIRGGEIKHDRWSEYEFIETMQALNTKKHQQKILAEPMASPIVWNSSDFLLCSLFWLGSFILFGEGLRRTQLQIEDRLEDMVFFHEYHFASSNVARRIGQGLKSNLPSTASKEQKATVSQKSLRYGAITELTMHPKAGLFEVCGRSGHKTGVNIDSYVDQTNPARGLVGARIMAKHTNFSKPEIIPCPWWLPHRFKDSFTRLLTASLSGNCVPAFQPTGHLYRFMQHLLCIHIFWYGRIKDEYGSNHPWVLAWNELGQRAQIVDPMEPDKCVEIVLEEWSLCLWERHDAVNDRVDETDMSNLTLRCLFEKVIAGSQRSQELLVAQQRLREDMKECFGHMRSDIVSMQKECASTRSAYIKEHQEHMELKEEIRRLRDKTAFLKSPSGSAMNAALSMPRTPEHLIRRSAPTPPSSGSVLVLTAEEAAASKKAKAPRNSSVVTQHQRVDTNHGTVVFGAVSAPQALSAPQVDPQANRYERKVDSVAHLLTGKASKVGEEGKIMLHVLFAELRKERGNWFAGPGEFHDGTRKVHASCKKAKAKFRYVMELVESAITPAQRSRLCSRPGPDHPNTEDIAFYDAVRDQTMDKMLTLEDKNPEVEKATQKKTPGCAPKPTVLALGARVKNYKNLVREQLNYPEPMGRYDPTPLIPGVRRGLPNGTPKGNKSIKRMFAINGPEENTNKRARNVL